MTANINSDTSKVGSKETSTEWSLWIGDSFCVWEYKIEGRSDKSINDLMQVVKTLVGGNVIERKCIATDIEGSKL